MSSSTLPRGVIEVADGFWNIRGSFKLGGVIDIGTHASLVRRASGAFTLLDTLALSEPVAEWLDSMTDNGAALESIVNVHPFHTVFVEPVHRRYPDAALYGTARHADKLGELPWQADFIEGEAAQAAFADDFEFSIPAGVDFISDNPKLHFSSVLVFHPASRTLHVDDTVLYLKLPKLLRFLGKDRTRFHMTLAKVLQPRAGAAAEFRAWARGLIERCREIDNLCAAHSAALLGRRNDGPSVAERIEEALSRVEKKLAAHERKHG